MRAVNAAGLSQRQSQYARTTKHVAALCRLLQPTTTMRPKVARTRRESILYLYAASSATTPHDLSVPVWCAELKRVLELELDRRTLVAAAAAFLVISRPTAHAGESDAVKLYRYEDRGYCLELPTSWEQTGKAGADVLFEDPIRRSTSVGVTISPVRVQSIIEFGSLEDVGQKLLRAEKIKESTLGVEMLVESARKGAKSALLYTYEYELNSTRGRKRVINTVTIYQSKLYILNAAYKCDKEACSAAAEEPLAQLRTVARSFDVF